MGGCPGIGVPAEIPGDEEQREGCHVNSHHQKCIKVTQRVKFWGNF